MVLFIYSWFREYCFLYMFTDSKNCGNIPVYCVTVKRKVHINFHKIVVRGTDEF